MRTLPRPRRRIGGVTLALLRPALRYSYTREAYVLRGIGNQHGPVFVHETPDEPTDERPIDGG